MQYDFGTINPSTTSGSDLATLLGYLRNALETCHSGASRPSYAQTGTIWKNTSVSPALLCMYDGSNDIILGEIDDTNHIAGFMSKNTITVKTTAYIIVAGDRDAIVAVDATSGALTFTLLTAATAKNGFAITILKKDSSANAVTVARGGSDIINGATSFTLSAQYQSVRLISDGASAWYISGQSDTSIPTQLATRAGTGANTFTGDQLVAAASGGNFISKNTTGPGVTSETTGGWLAKFMNAAVTPVEKIGASLDFVTTNVASTTEAGYVRLKAMTAGLLTEALRIGAGIYTPGATGGDPGAGWINAQNGYQVNGVPISTASASYTLIGTLSGTGSVDATLTTGTWTGFRRIVVELDTGTQVGTQTLSVQLTNDGGATWSSNSTGASTVSATYRGVFFVDNAQSTIVNAALITGTVFSGASATTLTPSTSDKTGPFNGIRLHLSLGVPWTVISGRVYGVK